jgi:hypothetical protein
MDLQSNSNWCDQFKMFLLEIIPFGTLDNIEKYVKFAYTGSAERGTERINAKVYTGAHVYSISATDGGYLGCIAVGRKPLPGSEYAGGNDLPDGRFGRETWEHIKAAMLRYELVKLAPVVACVADAPVTKACTNEVSVSR